MKRRFQQIIKLITPLSLILFLLSGCAEILQLLSQMDVKEPQVNISSVKMTGLSFDRVDLLFDISINNPNNVGIKLAGFDYDLLLNDNSFLKGEQSDGLEIKASGQETVKLPISLNYMNMYNMFSSLKDRDSINYQLKTGLLFNMPALGDIRLPISKSGHVPSLKMPSISLSQLKMDKLGFTGADLTLEIKLKNPNALSLLLKDMNYQLNVSGTNWIQGKTSKEMSISDKGESLISIPFSLNFLSMGQSVYNLLSGNQELNYNLKGNASLGSSLKLLGDFELPFDQSGEVKIFK